MDEQPTDFSGPAAVNSGQIATPEPTPKNRRLTVPRVWLVTALWSGAGLAVLGGVLALAWLWLPKPETQTAGADKAAQQAAPTGPAAGAAVTNEYRLFHRVTSRTSSTLTMTDKDGKEVRHDAVNAEEVRLKAVLGDNRFLLTIGIKDNTDPSKAARLEDWLYDRSGLHRLGQTFQQYTPSGFDPQRAMAGMITLTYNATAVMFDWCEGDVFGARRFNSCRTHVLDVQSGQDSTIKEGGLQGLSLVPAYNVAAAALSHDHRSLYYLGPPQDEMEAFITKGNALGEKAALSGRQGPAWEEYTNFMTTPMTWWVVEVGIASGKQTKKWPVSLVPAATSTYSLAPGGEHLVYAAGRSLEYVHVPTNRRQTISLPPAAQAQYLPAWSPDGSKLAVAGDQAGRIGILDLGTKQVVMIEAGTKSDAVAPTSVRWYGSDRLEFGTQTGKNYRYEVSSQRLTGLTGAFGLVLGDDFR